MLLLTCEQIDGNTGQDAGCRALLPEGKPCCLTVPQVNPLCATATEFPSRFCNRSSQGRRLNPDLCHFPEDLPSGERLAGPERRIERPSVPERSQLIGKPFV